MEIRGGEEVKRKKLQKTITMKRNLFFSLSLFVLILFIVFTHRETNFERERERGCPRGKLKILNKMTRQNGGEKRGEFGRVNGI